MNVGKTLFAQVMEFVPCKRVSKEKSEWLQPPSQSVISLFLLHA